MFYVYMHTFPNGKIYVGQTKKPIDRWLNGEGYRDNEEMYRDILKYGWNNIKHEIIATFGQETDAIRCEAVMIFHLNSENKEIGYNRTNYRESFLNSLVSRTPVDGVSFEKYDRQMNCLEASGLPISACKELINQWIFDERKRSIATDKLINGMPYSEISKKHHISHRQAQNIVYQCSDIISEHLPL